MKKLILICFMILLISNISAIKINEIEMNPEDGRDGKEWIELYNDENEDIDLSGWEVWEGIVNKLVNPKRILTIPDETTLQTGEYFIIEFSNKLNNDGDYVLLKDSSGNEIDETGILKETSSSAKTWQLCDPWEFLEATKGKKNNCENEVEEEPEKETDEVVEINEEVIKNFVEEGKEVYSKQTPLTPKVISLTPKDIKSEENIESLDKTDYAKYGFIAFCILIGVLLILKNKRKQKNEIV